MEEDIEMEVFPYETESYGVTVRVLPEYLKEESDPLEARYLWRYTVEIENNTEEALQLMRRHWIIMDGAGRRQEVKGDGVVGEQPVITPGERFTYMSGCPLNEPSGLMMGSYELRRDDGEALEVDIPAFSLDSPHNRAAVH